MDEVVDVVNDKNAMPNFDNARTIEIWALLELAGKRWACVKTDWIAIVRDLPLARSDLNELFNALSTMTCEHCKCKSLTTNLWTKHIRPDGHLRPQSQHQLAEQK